MIDCLLFIRIWVPYSIQLILEAIYSESGCRLNLHVPTICYILSLDNIITIWNETSSDEICILAFLTFALNL